MTKRERSYQWEDPRPVWETIGNISGLEFLQREVEGLAPPLPIAVSMGFKLISATSTQVVYEGQPGEDHYNAVGGVQGGWLASFMDAAASSAVYASLPAGGSYTTLDLKINFIRGVTVETGPLRCIAELVHGGRRMGTAEAKIFDGRDKLIAHGGVSCMIFSAT